MPGALRPALATALLALAGLGGCDAIEIEDPNEPKESERSLKVAHAAGETRVPAQADRVVALSPDALDTAIGLGVEPAGAATREDGRFPAYLGRRTRGIERTGTYSKPFLNAVEFVGPNLILGQKRLQRRYYRRLDAIAPTVMTADSGHSWEVNARLFGESLGRTDQAEALVSRYDRRADAARRALDPLGELEVSVARVLPGGVRALASRSFAGTVIGDAGLGRPRAQRRERESIDATGRRLSRLEGDVLLVAVAPGAERRFAALERSAAWRALGPVRSGRELEVPDDVWGTGSGVLAAEAALHDLRRLASES